MDMSKIKEVTEQTKVLSVLESSVPGQQLNLTVSQNWVVVLS